MSDSRPTKKERKNKSRSARRKMTMKNQGFKPVIKTVDIEKIKQAFKANALAEQGEPAEARPKKALKKA